MSLRPALRIAARDALRARGRSVLVLVMIALPVLGVTAADVLIHTADVSTSEGLDRRLGAAQAQVRVSPDMGRVAQTVDPDRGGLAVRGKTDHPLTLAQVQQRLGGDRPALELRVGSARVTVPRGVADVEVTEVDLRDPLTRGLARLTSGRPPRTTDEVVVSQALVDRGVPADGVLELADGTTRRVVGTAESTDQRDYPLAYGLLGSLGVAEQTTGATYLVGGAPVTWAQVRELNAEGATVLSRQVVLHPPSASELPEEVRDSTGGGADPALIAVAVLIVVMALVEVVLLAGPAFAVSARRQSRTLALLVAGGGTPRQARLVVLAGGLVLGGAAAVLGVLLGLGVARLGTPVLQRFSSTWLGPFQVPWLQLLGVAGFGLVSALLAAVVPAWIASRQDVVAVLAGRRGDRRPSARSPFIGLALIGLGVAGSAWGAQAGSSSGGNAIAASAIVAVLGMILVVPVVVVALARLGARLPLPLRYAVRDAARHRTRTVPAVAAVAATVAGVVALGIGNASDAAENRATYTPQLPMGQGAVLSYAADPDWTRLRAAVRAGAPGAEVADVPGVPFGRSDGGYRDVSFHVPGAPDDLTQAFGSVLGSPVLVATDTWPGLLGEVSAAEQQRAVAVLEQGGAVVLTTEPVTADTVRLRSVTYVQSGEREGPVGKAVVPAYYLTWPNNSSPAAAVISPQAARAVSAPVETVGLSLPGATLTGDQEDDVDEALGAVSSDAQLYVERGFQQEDAERIALLVLGALGAILMLGGTLTATFLALSDARPDLATLSAVGAAPRTRRGVAAAYAVVVGLVGAVLGAAVGFVPGIAITYPLTSNTWDPQATGPSHYLDVPWLLIGTLVVALPLVTALLVGLTARSRLPLVARLD